MSLSILVPKYRRNPNEKIVSLYSGIASGNRTVTVTKKVSLDRNHIVAERQYGPGLPRGQGGRVAVFVIGGLETTLDEMEFIAEAKKQKPFEFQRTNGQIAKMCQMLRERRNAAIRYYRKNPSEAPKPQKKKVRLYLPVGCRYVGTSEPGLKVLARI